MSHLKNLKLATATPVRVNADPAQRIRDKVIAALEEQKAMAEAKIAGRSYAPTHMIWQKDDAGQRVQVEKPRRVRQGWFEDAEAKTFFTLRYAGKSIEFAKDKNAIEVPGLDKLPGIIDQLIAATKAGELDAQLAAAADERSQQLRRKQAA